MAVCVLDNSIVLNFKSIVLSFIFWTHATHVGSERQAQSNTGLGKQKW